MNLICRLFGHNWQLAEPGSFERFGKCRYHCKLCGAAETRHQFHAVEGRCYDRCSVCGEQRYFCHQYEDGKCVRCGEPAPLPRGKLSYEESMANADEGISGSGVLGGW